MKPVIVRRALPKGRRILVVSDIHGALDHLQGLLETVRFSEDDLLILDGDLLEKGPESLATLRYILRLRRTHAVWALLGNCDGLEWLFLNSRGREDARRFIVKGRSGWQTGLLRQMADEISYPVSLDMDMDDLKRALLAAFPEELDFLLKLPHIIDTPFYTFVHGGLPEGDPETWDAFAVMKNDYYAAQGRRFDKWVIVGHTPVVLYREDITCANPIIDRESRLISIDGGCVLKDDGQLNALIIPEAGSEDFSFAAWDPFPVRRVKTAQAASEKSYYIRWGDNLVQVLHRGAEFSRVRHKRTGYEMDVPTRFLQGEGDEVPCNDVTDYRPALAPGDEVRLVAETSRGYMIKFRGVSGWYGGEFI